MAVKRTKPKRPRDPRPGSAKPKLIEPESIAGLHPTVPVEIAGNLVYQLNDLSSVTRDACEVLLRSHPIGVVPMPGGQYRVLTGVRTWQVYEAFRQRALTVPLVLPVVVHHTHGNPEQHLSRLWEIAIVDLIVSGQLLSLHPATAQQQLGSLYALLPPERIPEVIRVRHGDTAPVPAAAPVKRPRGRPRKIRT